MYTTQAYKNYEMLLKRFAPLNVVHVQTRDIEAAILSTASASTPIASASTASASTNKKQENDRWPMKSVSCTMTWPSMKNAMDASYAFFVLSHYWHRTFIQTYSATSPFNPHQQTDKTFSPSYSSGQITYVEAVNFRASASVEKEPLPPLPLPHPWCKHRFCYAPLYD